MAKGFAPWSPSKATRPDLEDVLEVIEAERDEWPLSQRYWLYKLMAKKGWLKVDEYKKCKYPKDKQLARPHRNLNNILDRARRAGLVPWAAVVSKRGEVNDPYSLADAEALADRIELTIQLIQFDRQAGQDRQVVLWCETEGLVPLVEKVTDKYGATLLAGKGFDVIGRKHDFAERIAEKGDVLILHMGDLDKSGHSIPVALEADLRAFIEELGVVWNCAESLSQSNRCMNTTWNMQRFRSIPASTLATTAKDSLVLLNVSWKHWMPPTPAPLLLPPLRRLWIWICSMSAWHMSRWNGCALWMCCESD